KSVICVSSFSAFSFLLRAATLHHFWPAALPLPGPLSPLSLARMESSARFGAVESSSKTLDRLHNPNPPHPSCRHGSPPQQAYPQPSTRPARSSPSSAVLARFQAFQPSLFS